MLFAVNAYRPSLRELTRRVYQSREARPLPTKEPFSYSRVDRELVRRFNLETNAFRVFRRLLFSSTHRPIDWHNGNHKRYASQPRRPPPNSFSHFFWRCPPRESTLKPPGRAGFFVRDNDCAILFGVLAGGFTRLNHLEWSIGGANAFYERDKIANL